MAVCALRLGMGTKQWKFRLLGMIKLRTFPSIHTVTILTLRAKFSTMHILQRMTAVTICGQILVNFTNMTAQTGRFEVATKQRELRFPVVERRNLFPRLNHMTSFAFFAQIALMRLAFSVASKTRMRCFTEFFTRNMARTTCNTFVTANQRKFRFIVIEDDLFQLDQFMIPTSMFCVTRIAFRLRNNDVAAMKMVLCIHILLNIFVATETEI